MTLKESFLTSPNVITVPNQSLNGYRNKGSFVNKSNVCKQQAPVVQTLDNAIHWINYNPLDNSIGFASGYPLDSDLSGGQRYPSFEQLGPGDDDRRLSARNYLLA